MNEKCFCHIGMADGTRYKVKDADARNNINTINENINTINENINTINSEIDKQPKVLIIGDSYGVGYTQDGTATSWVEYFRQYCGFDTEQVVNLSIGGSSFAGTDTPTANKYSSLLNNATTDEDITDVIICAGYNDMLATSYDSMLTEARICDTTIKTKFPNAKIHIGWIGQSTLQGLLDDVSLGYRRYSDIAVELNWHYLQNVEVVLRGLNTMSHDNVHPTDRGYRLLGKYIAQAFKYGAADVHYEEKTIGPISMKLDNHNLTINVLPSEIDYGASHINLSSSDGKTYAHVPNTYYNNTNSYIIGWETAKSLIDLNVFFTNQQPDYSNKFYNLPAHLCFKGDDSNGLMYIAIEGNIDEYNGSYPSFTNINWLTFKGSKKVVDIMDV